MYKVQATPEGSTDMKPLLCSVFWVAFSLNFALCTLHSAKLRSARTSFGMPTISRFHGNAAAAISLQFDDAMTTQLENALPLLNARKLKATFFVITDSHQYRQHLRQWEVDVPKAGHDLGNHTAHHKGAKTLEELSREVDDCSDRLATVYGPAPRLTSFAIPGGVPWNVTHDQLDPILRKRHLVLAQHRNFFDEKTTDPITFVQRAIQDGQWSNVCMHGIGGEWLSTSVPTLTKLLDFLVAHRTDVWVAPEIEIYKYVQERDAASAPVLTSRNSRGFSIVVKCDPEKLAFTDRPIPVLYDQPLTVEVSVPDSWKSYSVYRGRTKTAAGLPVDPNSHVIRLDVRPNDLRTRVAEGRND